MKLGIELTSIRGRLLAIILTLLIGAMGALAAASYYYSSSALTKSVQETAMAIGSDVSGRLQATTDKLITQLEDLASIARMRGGDDKAAMEGMKETLKRIGQFEYLIFIKPDGAAARTNDTTGNLADREYFKKAMKGEINVSDPLVTRGNNKISINMAVPIKDQNAVKGVLAGNIPLDTLSAIVAKIKFEETGYGFLVDDSGMAIAHPKRPEVVGKLNYLENTINPELKLGQTELDGRIIALIQEARDKNIQTFGKFTFVDGIERVAVVTPVNVPGNRWLLIVNAPVAEVNSEVRALGLTMGGIALAAILLAVLIIIPITGRFAKPIVILRDEAVAMADGDLRQRQLTVTGRDEIGQLVGSFQSMLQGLRQIVTGVQKNAEQIAAASEELTASAEQTSQAANQVAGSIESVAAGSANQIKELGEISGIAQGMSAALQEVAASAGDVTAMADKTVAATKNGQVSIDKAIAQINNVSQGTKTVGLAIDDLNKSSLQIGEIVNLISEIAGQTNLLALNAAIEAARAGEAGRGFAVVAEEVRKLAEQSNSAASEIKDLIGKNSGNLSRAVEAMESGSRDVEQGVELANVAGKEFAAIAGLIETLSTQIREISAAVEEMAAGTQRLVQSVGAIEQSSKAGADEANTVSAATEEQLASMTEIASASENLARLASELQQQISKFRV
jgi:methyl-accepting chemotaxis protein